MDASIVARCLTGKGLAEEGGLLSLFWFSFPLGDAPYAHLHGGKHINSSNSEKRAMTQELTADLFQYEVLESEIPVLVDFWSPSCAPCKLQHPVLDELASEGTGRFQIKKINVWEEPELATRFRISAVPTLLIFRHGEVVRSLVGFQDKSKLLRALQEVA
jgi:thioredoxin 1